MSAATPLSWDFIMCWFASSGGVDQCQPERGRNTGEWHGGPRANTRDLRQAGLHEAVIWHLRWFGRGAGSR